MLSTIFFMVKILLPAMSANAIPVLLRKIPILNIPIHKKRFGKNKTWRWFLWAIIVWWAVMQLLIWFWIFEVWEIDNFFNLKKIFNWLFFSFRFCILGGLMWLWAIAWDLVESFIKRRLWIAPWKWFSPWDQIDYILWFFVITYFFHSRLPREPIVYCIYWWIMSFLAHNISYHIRLINTKR